MPRLDSIRKNGAIPERRHDAFLLALLLAVGFNVAVFAAQALLPHLAALLQMLGAEANIAREEAFPFVLVDPSFLDEPPPEAPAATSAINREARQEAMTPEAGRDVYRPEGVQEQLLLAEGNPGEIDPGVDSSGLPDIEAVGGDANAPTEPTEAPPEAMPEEAPEETPPEPAEEPPPPEEAAPEPLPEPPPEAPAEPLPPPPQPEETPDPSPQPLPEQLVEAPPEAPPAEPPPEPVPVEEPAASPLPELTDLAALPVMEGGIFDPDTRMLRERAREVVPPAPARIPERRESFQPEQAVQPWPQPATQPMQEPQTAQRPDQPVRPQRRNRENAPQATVRQMGGAGVAGGARPRQNMRGRSVDLFDDPYMALLRDRYPEYMTKLGRMLQDSLNRTMVLYPNYYATGQARLLFRIDAGGLIDWYETQYPVDGSDNTLRAISERTLLEAGPFDPPPAAMLADPAFQRMSLNVYIY